MQAHFISRRLGAQLPILAAFAAIVGGGLTGGFLGALLGGRRRSLGAAIGTLAGAGTAAAGVAVAGDHLLDRHPEGVTAHPILTRARSGLWLEQDRAGTRT
ncbi:MAG: hypothetical protein ABR592_04135 [Nitriliruptorales bacterium]